MRQPETFIDTLLSETIFPSLKTIGLQVSNYTLQEDDDQELMPLISKLASRIAIDRITIRVGENKHFSGGIPATALWEEENWELVRIPEEFFFFLLRR